MTVRNAFIKAIEGLTYKKRIKEYASHKTNFNDRGDLKGVVTSA